MEKTLKLNLHFIFSNNIRDWEKLKKILQKMFKYWKTFEIVLKVNSELVAYEIRRMQQSINLSVQFSAFESVNAFLLHCFLFRKYELKRKSFELTSIRLTVLRW